VNRRALLLGSAAIGAAVLPPWGARADDALSNLLQRVSRARTALRTLRGPFVQTRTIGILATDVRSRGNLTLVRPDRLRWQLEPPDNVTFWVGPEGLAYRTATARGQLSEAGARMASALKDLKALLGGDLTDLTTRWTLRVVRDDPTGAEIEANSRDAQGTEPATPTGGGVRGMRFGLAADLVRPTRAVLWQGSRDHTTIDFGDLVVNAAIDPSSMTPG
jgi:hypothetical protein